MPSLPRAAQAFSLYRAHLREIRRLPHLYLQQFYKVKTRNDARALLTPSASPLTVSSRLRNGHKTLRKLRAANSGNVKAFQRILSLAYGQAGKLKWELLEPLTKDPHAERPVPIIPGKKNSLPPIYPKPLLALLTNAESMATRPLKKDVWTKKQLIGPRADPYSDEAHLFGPFPKRREYNVQWRFFKTEIKKVLPPLEISVKSRERGDKLPDQGVQGPQYVDTAPLQELGLVSDIQSLVGVPCPAPLTRKERAGVAGLSQTDSASASPRSARHPSRWVRRRYRELLSKVPVLTYTPGFQGSEGEEGAYHVQQWDRAPGKALATNANVRKIDEINLAWLVHEGIGPSKSSVPQKASKKQK